MTSVLHMNYSMSCWTRDKIMILLRMYREADCLWDPEHSNHKCRTTCLDAWLRISQAVNIDVLEVKRKSKNLVSQFHRERKKFKDLKMTRPGAKFNTKWFPYNHMLFLVNKNKDEPREECESQSEEPSTMPFSRDEIKTEIESILDEAIPMNIENEDINGEMFPEENITELKCSYSPQMQSTSNIIERAPSPVPRRVPTYRRPKTSKSWKTTTDERQKEAYSIMKSIYNSRSKKDNCDVFGEFVAGKLKSLKTDHARNAVEHILSNIMWEASLGKYDYPQNQSQLRTSQGESHSCNYSQRNSYAEIPNHDTSINDSNCGWSDTSVSAICDKCGKTECRLCLSSVPAKSSVSVYDSSHSLMQRIQNCCELQVKKNDGMSDTICTSCDSKLKSFSDFKIMCIKNCVKRLSEGSDIKTEEIILDDFNWESEANHCKRNRRATFFSRGQMSKNL